MSITTTSSLSLIHICIEFKATGKQILEPGWRVIFGAPSAQSQEEKEEKGEEENVLPAFGNFAHGIYS